MYTRLKQCIHTHFCQCTKTTLLVLLNHHKLPILLNQQCELTWSQKITKEMPGKRQENVIAHVSSRFASVTLIT